MREGSQTLCRALTLGLVVWSVELLSAGGEEFYTIQAGRQEWDVVSFMESASQLTRKTFLYDPMLKGKKISVILPEDLRVTKEQLLKFFESVLEKHNFSVTDYKDFVKVVPLDTAKTAPMEIVIGEPKEPLNLEDKLMTLVYPLKYADPTRAQSFLSGLINRRSGNVAVLPESNLLVITDFSANLSRLYEVIKLMDVKAPEELLEVIPLKYVPAEEVAQKLSQILQAKLRGRALPRKRAVQLAQITPFPRTNSLIVYALPDLIEEIKQVVKLLDVKYEVPAKIHVYELQNAKAEELAKVLQQIFGGVIKPPPGVKGSGARALGARTTIVADPHTNSLIITAEEEEYAQLEEMIRKLDLRRPQVVIEAAIVELSENIRKEISAEVALVDKFRKGKTQTFFATNFGLTEYIEKFGEGKRLTIPGEPGSRKILGRSGALGTIVRGSRGRLPLIVSALEATGEARVLAYPKLLTNDNQKATFKSTQQEPTRTLQTTPTGGDITSFGGFQEAGITLEITPHISGSNYLQLEILQKIEGFTGERDPEGVVPPPKFSREIETMVTIPDGEVIVLGGLTRQDRRDSITGVPLLKDIPLLGFLFRSSTKETRKTTLYVFISPQIMTEENFSDLTGYSSGLSEKVEEKTGENFRENIHGAGGGEDSSQ